ncbi:hypothetical protein B566_EDAN011806 [Ephemera danica]|nr:hypothetical protein B566_EDAN011806 [Ephemera danica]
MPGCNGKTQQHKKERQHPHQDQQMVSGEQEQPKTNTNEMVEHVSNNENADFTKTICSSPPECPASATHIMSVSSPAPSSSGVSSASKDSSSSGTCPHACSVTGSHKNGGKRVCGHCSSELSDCGYGTQAENQESVSTSSNEDELPQNGTSRGMKPVHQKPHGTNKLHNRPQKLLMSHQEKQDWRRKKIVKRSRTNILNIKALMHHTPTDEDISHLLKEFTVDFLLKGYGPLVQELHAQMLSELGTPVDTSHFFWLVTYFLKFAAQLDLELDCISPVLSYKVVSYLTFEGVNLCEQLQIALLQQETDLKPSLRRLHLVVTAIREFIQALDTYKKSSHLSPEDKELLLHLQHQMSGTSDLRNLFVLLLRHYNPGFQSKQYLQDLICTNHILLLSMEQDCSGAFDIMEHIKQFATAEMMQQYGRLLESFRDNGQFINDCVFTMMHHISGDLNLVSALFQPGILKTFSLIWEEDFQVCDDWSDLIEYVIHKFVNTPRRGHPMLPLVTGAVSPDEIIIPQIVTPPTCTLESNTCRWTKEECDTLYWYHEQGAQTSDPVGTILRLYAENGSTCKTRVGVEQSTVLTYPPFVLLLHKLGIHLPADVGKVFPRIPHFWTAEALFATAQKLGNVQPESLKFDVKELQQLKEASQETMTPADVVNFGVLDINDPDGTIYAGDNPNTQLSPRHSLGVPHNPATLSTIRFAPMASSPVQGLHSNMSKMSISDEDSSAQASAGEETPAGP